MGGTLISGERPAPAKAACPQHTVRTCKPSTLARGNGAGLGWNLAIESVFLRV